MPQKISWQEVEALVWSDPSSFKVLFWEMRWTRDLLIDHKCVFENWHTKCFSGRDVVQRGHEEGIECQLLNVYIIAVFRLNYYFNFESLFRHICEIFEAIRMIICIIVLFPGNRGGVCKVREEAGVGHRAGAESAGQTCCWRGCWTSRHHRAENRITPGQVRL